MNYNSLKTRSEAILNTLSRNYKNNIYLLSHVAFCRLDLRPNPGLQSHRDPSFSFLPGSKSIKTLYKLLVVIRVGIFFWGRNLQKIVKNFPWPIRILTAKQDHFCSVNNIQLSRQTNILLLYKPNSGWASSI